MPDTEPEKTPVTPDPAPDAGSTPPWGDNFDAAKAWTLIQNLRTDKETLKGANETLTADLQARDATITELETRATTAETEAKTTKRELLVEKALRKHPVDDDYLEFLSGDTEEEIFSKAERLSKLGKPKEEPKGDPDPAADPKPDPLAGRPTPTLTPGHGGEAAPPFDPAAIAKKARESGAY